jgi:hypothetical protein
MTRLLDYGFEDGTAGAAVGTSLFTSATATFTADRRSGGALAARLPTGGILQSAQWALSGSLYVRMYLTVETMPAAATAITQIRTSTTNRGVLWLLPDGALRVTAGAGTILHETPAAMLKLGELACVELGYVQNGAGELRVRSGTNAYGATPDYQATTGTMATQTVDRVVFRIADGSYVIDDVAVDDATWPGPVLGPLTFTRWTGSAEEPLTLAGAWNGVTIVPVTSDGPWVPPQPFLVDGFTTAANDLLVNRTAPTGGQWALTTPLLLAASRMYVSKDRGGGVVTSDYGQPVFHNKAVPPSADYRVEADLVIKTLNAAYAAGVAARLAQTAMTGVFAWLLPGTGWQLFQYVAGTKTVLATSNTAIPAAGATVRLVLLVKGTQATLKVNGATVLTATTAVSQVGHAGILGTGQSHDATGIWIDNVEATPV